MISKVFIDTNVFVALKDDTDSTHEKALKLLKILIEQKTSLFTSSDIIAESLTVISRKLGKDEAMEFLKELKTYAKEIFIDESIHAETRKFFAKVKSKNISFIDCSSVIAMKRNKIKYIFSFDEDFKKMGVELLADAVK
ncbi:MAG: PIN domain-containing protein [Candidatus Woesebacteria bacterium]|nr:PIN domain-containing protein [Candidatus Woesebacteria bacterium]